MRRQPVGEAGEIRVGQHRARRVGGVGDEHHLRALVRAIEDRVHVHDPPALGQPHGPGAGGTRGDGIHAEAVLGVEHLVAVAGIGLRQQPQQLVRARAAHDPRRVEPVGLADGGAQGGVRAVGVAVQVPAGAGEGRAGGVAGAVRVLVRRQLDHLGHAARARGPALVGGDVEDARLRPDVRRQGVPPLRSRVVSSRAAPRGRVAGGPPRPLWPRRITGSRRRRGGDRRGPVAQKPQERVRVVGEGQDLAPALPPQDQRGERRDPERPALRPGGGLQRRVAEIGQRDAGGVALEEGLRRSRGGSGRRRARNGPR